MDALIDGGDCPGGSGIGRLDDRSAGAYRYDIRTGNIEGAVQIISLGLRILPEPARRSGRKEIVLRKSIILAAHLA